MAPSSNPFVELVSRWRERLEAAAKAKRGFAADAEEAMTFYTGSVEEIYSQMGGSGTSGMRFAVTGENPNPPNPSFRAAVNKVFELKSVIGPYVYHNNPHRLCTARLLPEIEDEAAVLHGPAFAQAMKLERLERKSVASLRAKLMQAYLNYTPNELTGYGLKRHARLAVDEAIIKGRGCLWTSMIAFPGAEMRIVGSTFDSVDKLLIDPDAESLDDAGWIARMRIWPTWKVEEVYGLKPGSVKGNLESAVARATGKKLDGLGPFASSHRDGLRDLVVLYEVYSKIGIGGRLPTAGEATDRGALREADQVLGDFIYLVVAEGHNFFLNLPSEVSVDDLGRRLAWPTPFWVDGLWPVACLDFHTVPRSPWPMSHIRPAMAELKAINWIFSFVVTKIAKVSRDFVAVLRDAGDEVVERIQSGKDLTVLELNQVQKSINDAVQFLRHPPMHPDLWKVLDMVMALFERRTGLGELMYGQGAMRSAEEAALKGERTQIRITSMANEVEDWMTGVARAEAFAAWYHLEPKDLLPVLGPVNTYLWNEHVRNQSRESITRELDYRIEAGSVKKPNQERQIANMTQALQTIMPILTQFIAINPAALMQVNALLGDWAKSMDLDPSRYLIDPATIIPPAPPMGPEGPGSPGIPIGAPPAGGAT